MRKGQMRGRDRDMSERRKDRDKGVTQMKGKERDRQKIGQLDRDVSEQARDEKRGREMKKRGRRDEKARAAMCPHHSRVAR